MNISITAERIPQHKGNLSRNTVRGIAYLTFFCSMALLSWPAAAQHKMTEAAERYQIEHANCLNGRSNEDKETCLKEANAALMQAKQGRLDDAGAQYQKNAELRCQVFESEDRQACERRMRGEGTVSGSVANGGIFRKLVIPEPEPKPLITPESGGATDKLN
ncbi:hypothetical protein [Solimicrobium silvestre]|uniref:Uncharacterized protein n=1 Tax=Solimicrobium silvestre TaxID=2099400 RepID=A0A2S9H3G3_9BURK|nr:hypothetical protein [Solimicrobium silvestre]PRC94524.1 hypothetical protein S2091_0527 [Solimicrobium silvestre]